MMSLKSIAALLGQGGAGLDSDLHGLLTEMQGLKVSVVAGAAAVVSTDAGGALADDAANITIQATKASGTLTAAAVAADDSCVVNGVTYTFKAAPTLPNHVLRTAGDNTANALALANAINAYESRYTGSETNVPEVIATADAAVVTVTAIVDGAAGNAIVLTGTPTRLAASGSGTLENGTDTGGIKSTTNLTSKSVILFWFNKQ
jgi:hypothetical protein